MKVNIDENYELQSWQIRVDPEINYDYSEALGKDAISVYLETWFDVDTKFGLNLIADDSAWLNMYADFEPHSNELAVTCIVSNDDGEDEFIYEPTENETVMIREKISEAIQKEYGQTPIEFYDSFIQK